MAKQTKTQAKQTTFQTDFRQFVTIYTKQLGIIRAILTTTLNYTPD